MQKPSSQLNSTGLRWLQLVSIGAIGCQLMPEARCIQRSSEAGAKCGMYRMARGFWADPTEILRCDGFGGLH